MPRSVSTYSVRGQFTPGMANTSEIGGFPSKVGEETESPGSKGATPDDIALFLRLSLGGPFGVYEEYFKNCKDFYLPGTKKEVRDCVCQCLTCQRGKPPKNTKFGIQFADVCTCPMQRVYVDYFGPVFRSKLEYQAVLVGRFSKFVNMSTVRAITAKATVSFLEPRLLKNFGVPKVIVSDNASIFKSQVFRDMCCRRDISHFTTCPYRPCPNHVGRFNRIHKAALSGFHNSFQTTWARVSRSCLQYCLA